MATSGTYVFNPTLAEMIDEAFERCGINPMTLSFQHIISARRSMNFMALGEWINSGLNFWQLELVTRNLAQGEKSFVLPVGTIDVLSAIVRRDGYDTELYPMGMQEYEAIPDKDIEGKAVRFAVDRQISPVIYLWQPSQVSTDVLVYRRLRQTQDSKQLSSTADVPPRFHDAFAAGLAARLAVKFSQDRLQVLKSEYSQALSLAKLEDRERGPMQINPVM